MNDERLEARLEAIVGSAHVLADAGVRAGYETDWTGRFRGEASFVVRPHDVAEVQAIVRTARELKAPLVPQGGNTGLVGGAVPARGAILLSSERMTEVSDPDGDAATIRAQAGATLESIGVRAASGGMFWPISHAGASRATVGGTIATNAGGVLSWRFGTARHHVRGVEAVLGDGRLVSRLDALVKDNAGYDLTGLLCGSEGTLGVVTSATLALQPLPGKTATALVALDAPGSLPALVRACRRIAGMWAAEVVFPEAMSNLCERLSLRPPFDDPASAYVFVRCVGEEALDALAGLADGRRSIQDERLWEYRERQNEAVGRAGVPVKLDVSVPVVTLEAFAGEVRDLARGRGVDALVFGHLLDGNLHVNLIGEQAADLEPDVLRIVVEHRGAVAAEHGIGRARTGWLSLARTADEVATMRAMKQALDPDGILNPGVLFG